MKWQTEIRFMKTFQRVFVPISANVKLSTKSNKTMKKSQLF